MARRTPEAVSPRPLVLSPDAEELDGASIGLPEMPAKLNATAFVNFCCGIEKSLQAEMAEQRATPETMLFSKRCEAAIADFALRLRENWPERFSQKYLADSIRKTLRQQLSTPDSATMREAFREHYQQLEDFKERKLCIVPLDGVGVPSEPVALGPFLLRNPTEEVFREMRSRFVSTLTWTSHTREEQDGFVAMFQKHFEESLKKGVILEWEVVADAEQANELFLTKAESLVDLLQMSTDIAEWCNDASIGLRGSTHSSVFSSWVLPLNSGGFAQPNRITGGVGELMLTSTNLQLMERSGILRLAAAIAGSPSLLETVLLRAAYWYAQALRHQHAGQMVLSLVVCLESILDTSNGRSTAESVALLAGKTPHERRAYYQLVLDAYAVRNKVAHNGSMKESFAGEQRFKRLVLKFIKTCIHFCDEIQEPSELNRLIGDLRFT